MSAPDTFPRLLIAHARQRGDHPAIREKDLGIWQTHSWADALAEVRSLACGLHRLGLSRGDTLAIVGDNRPRLYWAMDAAQALGAIPVPLYQDAVAEEMAYVLSNAEVRMAVVEDQEQVDYFPRLRDRRRSMAGFTSGGEQQMTAVGRALMARPTLILLDEPSMGLAPQIVEEILGIVRSLNKTEGVSFLLAEQNAAAALRYADHGYVLEAGRVVMDGNATTLAGNADVKEFYLGLGTAGRKSFRDAKHYRRRKRWLA